MLFHSVCDSIVLATVNVRFITWPVSFAANALWTFTTLLRNFNVRLQAQWPKKFFHLAAWDLSTSRRELGAFSNISYSITVTDVQTDITFVWLRAGGCRTIAVVLTLSLHEVVFYFRIRYFRLWLVVVFFFHSSAIFKRYF